MTLTLHRVATPAELADFVTLPRRIYAAEPCFVAPLDYDRRLLVDPKRSAFLTHGEAVYWIARRNGRPVGRISAQLDHLATAPELADVGIFGCLDAIDDGEVVGLLLKTAEDWLRGQGKRVARGPFTLSINAEAGLLIEGQARRPMLMMPWHPAYLEGHVEAHGYRLVKTLESYGLDISKPELAVRLKALGLDRRREGFAIRGLDMNALEADAERGRVLFNGSWAPNWGFVPVSKEEMASLIASFRRLLKSEYGVLIEREGELLGFALFLPNVFDLTAGLGGALGPLGWTKLAFRAVTGRFTSGRAVLFGVASRMVGSVSGASLALILADELVRRAVGSRVTYVECGWILDDNYAMRSVVDWLGAERTRRFGIFETSL